MRFSIWQKIALFLILIFLVVIIFRIAKNQSYTNSTVNEKTYFEYQEEALSNIKTAILIYTNETDDYELKLNKKTTTTVSDLLKVLQEGISINGKKYGPYIGQSPGGGLKYSDIFQDKPIRISIYKKEFDIDVRWSNSNEILIEN
ncbi:hypothetical protein [Pseudobacteroides cellulosolvens]|uniref:Uncharacterized protein n=1 Tax=Pseudobacteroides cellulosolvens ATCC 35603 = DSM 2933 TaxID=398512 RepID=A0A0L6JWY9_9FIRM|nr:hypothetical protein [Pseudobacteroides cellulosolvens]KNY30239.1 hypothetical protein Bccel_5516 [Pseudobacteroides cellulosolvens ATCC 35603 = DSM 2933]